MVAGGLPALANFTVGGFDPLAVKTFVTQEMLKRGFLAGTSLYASIAHEPAVLDDYGSNLAAVFGLIAACENDDDLNRRLDHGRAQSGFQRLA